MLDKVSFLDVILLVFFGTVLSSLICYFLQSQGAISAVGSIVSSCYGFLCGAYMPISSFSKGLSNVLAFFPGVHGTSLLRNHALSGVLEEMGARGLPTEGIEALCDVSDCNLYFFDAAIQPWVMYLVLGISVALLVGAYVLINVLGARSKSDKKTK